MLLRKSRGIAAYRLRKHTTPWAHRPTVAHQCPHLELGASLTASARPRSPILSQAPRTTAPASHTDPWQRPTLDVGASGIRLPDSRTERARRGAGRPTATLESRMARSVARPAGSVRRT